jgi:hypothetical protein
MLCYKTLLVGIGCAEESSARFIFKQEFAYVDGRTAQIALANFNHTSSAGCSVSVGSPSCPILLGLSELPVTTILAAYNSLNTERQMNQKEQTLQALEYYKATSYVSLMLDSIVADVVQPRRQSIIRMTGSIILYSMMLLLLMLAHVVLIGLMSDKQVAMNHECRISAVDLHPTPSAATSGRLLLLGTSSTSAQVKYSCVS